MINIRFILRGLYVCAIIFVLSTRCASAWLRWYAPDDELVQRSDSIVIGHVDGSFQAVKIAPDESNGAQLFEYRTTLVITGVVRGNAKVGQIPLIIHYGIKPVVLKEKPTIQDTFNPPAADQNTDRNTPVGIYDAATTCIGGPPSDNIRQDHLWFLRANGKGIGPGKEDTDSPGIWAPQDVQPLDQKEYFNAILSGDPAALSKFTLGDSFRAEQARLTQSRLTIERIIKNPDPSRRCDQLLPFFLNGEPARELALEQIFACGPIGCAKLVPVFQDLKARVDKRLILFGWQKAGYREASPIIIDWLRKEDQWWATLTTKDQIWAMEVGQRGGEPYNDPRAVSFRNIYCSVEALGSLQAVDAKGLVHQIRDRWKSIDPTVEQNNLANLCDQEFASGH